MQITRDRKKSVIDLYFNQHKTYAEIAQIEKMSPRDIHIIIKEEKARRQKYEHQQHRQEITSKAYKLFSEGKRPLQVAITLNLEPSQVTKLYMGYWKLKRLHILNLIHKETNGRLGPFLKLYKELIKNRGMTIKQIINVVEIAIYKLPHMESLYEQVKEQVERMQHTVQRLANDIEARKHKISALDKTVFSCEQDCRRTKQQLQELTNKKDKLERLIANILNGEDYSKLRQIVKENVKAVLSEKRVLISISFAAVIQTLKADPQMVKLIQNIPSANDGEQHKDDNNNIVKYLELNKHTLLDLAKKNYENLVEVLTNTAINSAVISTASPARSLPSSSSIFSNPFNQSDTYRIEESETFHNNKGDIAE